VKKYQFVLSLAFAAMVAFSVPAQARHFVMLGLGDSITQGLYEVGSPQYGSLVNGGYEPRLSTLISSDSNGRNSATIYNWGKMGEYSAGGVNRVGPVLNSRSADFILLMYGANDAFSFLGISQYTVADNIKIMANKARAKGVTPIVSNITPNTNTELGVDINSFIVNYYNPQIHIMALQENIALADSYTPLWAGWPFPNAAHDPVHPSSTGYQRIAEAWYKPLKRLLSPAIAPILQLLLLDD